jgi:protein-S-isoprenylcysteine O-methyltransferase Ste14
MARILALLYGSVAYLVFLGTFLYAIGFVTGLVVPKTVDTDWSRRSAKPAPSIFCCCHCLPCSTA